MALSAEKQLEMLRTMQTIRRFEERASEDYIGGAIYGVVHCYIGEEAVATGICSALNIDDRIISTHRGHGHCIAKGADLNRMMAELYGRATGYCKGKGGSMHIADFSIGMLGANGIVAGGIPIVTGAGLAAQLEGKGQVAVSFFGDGASNAGEKDFFLMKLYDNGTKQWTKQMGTAWAEYAYDVAVSTSNNIYVAGKFQSTNIWLAKHHDNGTQQWEKKLTGGNNLTWYAVEADTNNNIYVAGHSDGDLDGVSNAGSYDVYLAKYVDNGTREWLTSVGTSSNDSGDCCSMGLTVDSSNNIYVAAQTQGALDGSNAGNKDIFLSKFYDNGTRIWIKQIGSSAADVVFGASSDSSNNIFLGGYTSGGIDSNSSNGGQDGFLIKYNSDGDKE